MVCLRHLWQVLHEQKTYFNLQVECIESVSSNMTSPIMPFRQHHDVFTVENDVKLQKMKSIGLLFLRNVSCFTAKQAWLLLKPSYSGIYALFRDKKYAFASVICWYLLFTFWNQTTQASGLNRIQPV